METRRLRGAFFLNASPEITVAGPNQWFPQSRAIAGDEIQLLGKHWTPSMVPTEFEFTVDGQRVAATRPFVDEKGTLTAILPGVATGGVHRLSVREIGARTISISAEAKFVAVLQDRK
jgi:hypothetical protein